MTGFLEQRLNDGRYIYDTVGGPEWSTAVVEVAGGHESRNARWQQMRGRWELGERAIDQGELDALLSFFSVVRGKAVGFRLLVRGDYEVGPGQGVLGNLGGGQYQLRKRYAYGASLHDRDITKPVAATVVIAGGGTYSLDATTGIVSHTAGPAPTGWTGQFDVPVRFDTDQLRYRYMAENPAAERQRLYWLYSLPVVEIRP